MSTLRIDNFGPSAGGTTYSARGIAKAWVNFNGTGTIAARDSENVSSLTDNGTGDYTVNFSSAFGAGDYAVSTSSSGATGSVNRHVGPTSYAAGSVTIKTQISDGTGFDTEFVNVATHGDLA